MSDTLAGRGGLVRAAVIGLGVGRAHALAFARTEGCVVRWLYDLDPARAVEVAKEIGQGEPAESFEAILADPKTDVVALATYDDQHAGQAVQVLEAKKHLFCEKPLCRTLEELRSIEIARRAAGTHLRSNLVLRAAPVYGWLRDAIRAGELGTVYAFDGDYLYGRLHKITGGWRRDVEDYSVLLGGGVHMVDLMLWLLGERPESVEALGNRLATQGTEFRYDDFAAATFRFPSGAIGRITANFGCVHRHQHVVRVFGTEKTFLLDDQGPRLFEARGDDQTARPLDLATLPASKGDLIPGLVRAIRAGEDPAPAARHELDVIAATIAAHQAIGASHPTRIPYPCT